jgi:hypothetical protein
MAPSRLTTMWMSNSPRMEAMISIVSSSQNLKLKIKNKSFRVI